MDIVKGQERWGRVVGMSSYKQQNRSRVLAHEFWCSDEAFESDNKAGEGTPVRSRSVDPCDIRAAKQLFTTSPMVGV